MPNTTNQWVAYLRYAKGTLGDVRMWVQTKGHFFLNFLTHWSVETPTQRTPKSNQNQKVSIKRTKISISPRWATTKETFEFQSNFKCKKKNKACVDDTYILFKWKPSTYSEPYANKNKLVTFLIPELRQKRLSSVRVISGANKKKKGVRWRALTSYVSGNHPCIPSHMPTKIS